MIVTKFHENRLTIDREISEKHAIWLITFNVTLGIGIAISARGPTLDVITI